MSLKKKRIVSFLKDFIAAWQLPVKIKSVVDNGNGTYLLSVDKTYYLQGKEISGRKIVIGSVTYTVIDVTDNTSILLKGTVLPSAPSVFLLPPPFFFNGTLIQVNEELKSEIEDRMDKKTPMIFLRRPFSETVDAADKIDSFVSNTADITLLFLTEAHFDIWNTAKHDQYGVIPMRNMVDEFIEYIKNNKKFFKRLTDYQVTDLIKFAIVTSDGYTKSLFDDNYSGAQLDITLGFNYVCFCCD